MLDKPFAGFRRRTGGGYSMPEPRPQFGKGSETKVQMPEWLSKYYGGTAGRAENIADYFWQDLLPGGRIRGRTPTKEPPKDPGPDILIPEAVSGEPTAKASSAGRGAGRRGLHMGAQYDAAGNPLTGAPVLGGGAAGEPAYSGAVEGAGPEDYGLPPRKKIPQLPPGGIPPGGDGDGGEPSGGFDIGQILGFRPEVTPGLSPYQQLVGKYIPELANRPGAERIAGELGFINMAEAGRTPTVSGEDPQIEALRNVFEGTTKEILKNEATMGGYSRGSAVPDVLAKNWQAMLQPVLESQLGRKERAAERGQRARETGIMSQLELGGRETGRLAQALGFGTEQGALERGVEKERAAAAQAEKLRLAALAEQSVMGPMGLLPSSIGSRTGKAK